MGGVEKIEEKARKSQENVTFLELSKLCESYFGKPRNKGTSHHIYKMPWLGDPRVNIQKAKNGKAKVYQIKQVIKAIDKLKESKND